MVRGRKRGPDYEKNRARMQRHLATKEGVRIPKSGQVIDMHLDEFKATPIYTLAKAAYHGVDGIYKGMVDIYKDVKDPKKTVFRRDDYMYVSKGVIMRPIWRVPTDDLRFLSYSNSLVGTIHQIRADDAQLYCQYKKDPGFEFPMREEDKPPTEEIINLQKEWAQMLVLMGDKTLPSWRDRERFHDVIEMATRDTLAIDGIAIQKTLNRKGDIIDLRYLDPATIYKVDPAKGYDGNKQITHVQIVDGNVVETYEAGHITRMHRNALSDIRMRDHGFSPTESCVMDIMGLMYAMKDNMDRFNGRNPPQGFFSTKNPISEAEKQSIEMQWESAYYGPRMNFRLPMLFGVGDMQYHPLSVGDDLQFDRFIQLVAQFILARHGMDAAEAGLKFQTNGGGAQLGEANTDGRQKFSRDRSHGAMMQFHESWLGRILDPDESAPIRFAFIGVKAEDEDKKLDQIKKKITTFKTIDQIRKAEDDISYKEEIAKYFPNDPEKVEKLGALGGMILDPTFAQYYTQIINPPQQMGMGAPGEGGGDAPPPEDGADGNPEGEAGFGGGDQMPFEDKENEFDNELGSPDQEEGDEPQPGEPQ